MNSVTETHSESGYKGVDFLYFHTITFSISTWPNPSSVSLNYKVQENKALIDVWLHLNVFQVPNELYAGILNI